MTAPDSSNPRFHRHEDDNGIDVGSWRIRCEQGSIASSATEESLSVELGIKLPSMLFDRNALHLSLYSNGLPKNDETQPVFDLSFCVVDALRLVGAADPNIKVKAAERWAANQTRADVELTKLEHPSDWTFSTRYTGTISPSDFAKNVSDRPNDELQKIDYDALRDTTLPILFSTQQVLFEDELDDNGTAFYKVRIRVMPGFMFVLARFFLRIDSVMVRVYDTRYFHRFGEKLLVRETVERESSLHASALSTLHPTILRDPDMLAPQVPIVTSILQNIALPAS